MKKVLAFLLSSMLILTFFIGCNSMPDQTLLKKGKELEEKAKFKDAVANYEKLAKLYTKSPLRAEALYRAGFTYTNGIQDFPEAVKNFEMVVKEYPESKYGPQAQFMIGFVYANNQVDTSKAREAYNLFLEKYGDHELAASVKWELENLGKDINDILKIEETGTKKKKK
jgi:outer membrane protein assembly factor BamD (BamD/ComL family)